MNPDDLPPAPMGDRPWDVNPAFFWFVEHGIDARRNATTTPTTRTGQPLNPHTGQPITATPDELAQLVHLLSQLYTTDPDQD